MFRSKILFILLLLSSSAVQAQVLLTGDSEATAGETFSFNVFQNYFTGLSYDFYVGRQSATDDADSETVKNYAVSVLRDGATSFTPLTPATSWVNGTKDLANPLHGEQIAHMGFLSTGPLLVREDAPQNLYYLASGTSTLFPSVLKIENVKDANAATTAGIVKVVGSSSYAFAAVKPNGDIFGVSGSGIALVKQGTNELEQVAAVTGSDTVKAVGIDTTTSELKITNNLDGIDASVIDMHWDGILQRLYVCVKATSQGTSGDGARGVLVGYIQGVNGIPKLKYSAFAPADAFSGTSYIVGAVSSGAAVIADIKKVRTMHTTTGVSYVITLGNSAGSNADVTISALPVVNKKPSSTYAGDFNYLTDTTQGTLASKTVNAGTNLKEYFKTNGQISYFVGRGFEVAASEESHLTAQSDVAAQVGGAVAPGTVLDMHVYKDTVFVAVNGNNDEVQVYSSQALLDVDGAIKAWTPWRPVMRPLTSSHRSQSMVYNPARGYLYTLEGATSSTVKTIKRTTWERPNKNGLLGGTTSDGTVGFEALLKEAFPVEAAGIQGLFDFPKETAGFSQTVGERLSVMVATGYKKVMLIETGQDNGSSNFVPHIGSFSHADNITITDGVLDTARTTNTKIITLSGGALDTLGAISSAAIINDTINGGYLVVGGTGGLAVLRATSGGAGWTVSTLKKSFENIDENKSFASIGSYTNIRKLIADDQFLYVLTDKTFDRIPSSQLSGAVTPTVLATPADLGLESFDSFSDVLVSSKLALLATSKGLYRVGNGKNISTETTASDVDWTAVAFAKGPIPVTRLLAKATTHLEKDFAQQTGGGIVYVLASSVSDRISSVYRLSVRDIGASAIADVTVEKIPDDILSTEVGAYAHTGAYRNYFTTDGALPLMSRPYADSTSDRLYAFPAELQPSGPLIPRQLKAIELEENQNELGKLVYSSALGSQIIPTNDGLMVLE